MHIRGRIFLFISGSSEPTICSCIHSLCRYLLSPGVIAAIIFLRGFLPTSSSLSRWSKTRLCVYFYPAKKEKKKDLSPYCTDLYIGSPWLKTWNSPTEWSTQHQYTVPEHHLPGLQSCNRSHAKFFSSVIPQWKKKTVKLWAQMQK